MRLPLVAAVALTAAASSLGGCIIHDDYDPPPPPRDPYGDLAFEWSFDGVANCDDAGVDEVDVEIFQNGQLVLLIEREPCEGGGLVFTEIHEGLYEVFVDAYGRESELLYAGSFDIAVVGERVNDAGVVVLDRVGAPPPPPPATGSLAFFWAFAYPANDSLQIACDIAGAEEVDVIIEPQGTAGAEFIDTFPCEAEGVEVSNLPEGRYTLAIIGYGSYHGDAIMLYDSGDITVDIFGNTTLDLEDVVLGRVDSSFADFDVAWTFINETCASAGVSDVTLSFQRANQDTPEDSLTVPCNTASVARPTFVPGSYDVSAAGVGSGDVTWLGTTTVDLPPNSVAQVDLVLAPI